MSSWHYRFRHRASYHCNLVFCSFVLRIDWLKPFLTDHAITCDVNGLNSFMCLWCNATIVAIGRKVRFHHTLPFMTKQRCGSVAATSRQHQKFGIIDNSVVTSDILTWHQMWCSQINFSCLMFCRHIWCWLNCCFFSNFLSYQDENKLDSWFLSFFHQSLTLISGVTRGLTLGESLVEGDPLAKTQKKS